MTNSTSSSPGEVFNQIAEAFFTWVHNDIFPASTAAYDIIAVIVGLVLNILLLVSFKKRGLFNEPSSIFVFMLCVVDLLAYPLLLIPTIITAIAQKWLMSTPGCKAHGFMMVVIMILQFGFLCVLAIERTVKLTATESTYENVFVNKKKKNIIIAIVWISSVLISGAPFGVIDTLRYDFFHHGCMLDYGKQSAFLIVYFILVIGVTTTCFCICYGLIFHTRHTHLKAQREAIAAKKKSNADNPGSVQTEAFENDQTKQAEKDNNIQDTGLVNTQPKKQKGRQRRRKREEHLLFEVFRDDAENPAFHLSITYLALWAVIMVCYFPYFFVWFFNLYNTTIWGGAFNITLLVMHTSFVIKPIIYLGHNRHYRYVTKQTLPVTVRTRAQSVHTSVSGLAERMQKFLFKSPTSYKKLDTTLATHKAILVWKKKMKKNTGLFKINEGLEDQPKPDENDQTTALTENVSEEVEQEARPLTEQDKRHILTPSGINVSTSAAISYIERERERLRPSPLPGMPDSPDGSSYSPNQDDTTTLVRPR